MDSKRDRHVELKKLEDLLDDVKRLAKKLQESEKRTTARQSSWIENYRDLLTAKMKKPSSSHQEEAVCDP